MCFEKSTALTGREAPAGVRNSPASSSLPYGAAGGAPDSQKVPRGAEDEPADLLIRGGRVIDPSQDLDAVCDVAIAQGRIARIGADLGRARQVIPAAGKIVTPGLVDLHTHVFPCVGPYGIEPDPYCLRRGVTTVIDAGTSGAFSFPAFRRFIIERASTRIRALLHVVSIGMIAGGTPQMGELEDLRYCDSKLAVEIANRYRDVIVGFKIRFSRQYTACHDIEGMRRARAAAEEACLPLMMHIGGSYSPLPKLLAWMKKGDVVTHSFNSHPHGLLDAGGKVIPEAQEARARGVLFDVGHGAGSFSFAVTEKCLEQDFLPDTISSDLYADNVQGPVFDLVTTLSKFLALGMSVNDVVRRATLSPSRVFNFGAEIGTLRPGAEADVSVLELRNGDFTFTDSVGRTRLGRQKLEPVVTVRGGRLFYPQSQGDAEALRQA